MRRYKVAKVLGPCDKKTAPKEAGAFGPGGTVEVDAKDRALVMEKAKAKKAKVGKKEKGGADEAIEGEVVG